MHYLLHESCTLSHTHNKMMPVLNTTMRHERRVVTSFRGDTWCPALFWVINRGRACTHEWVLTFWTLTRHTHIHSKKQIKTHTLHWNVCGTFSQSPTLSCAPVHTHLTLSLKFIYMEHKSTCNKVVNLPLHPQFHILVLGLGEKVIYFCKSQCCFTIITSPICWRRNEEGAHNVYSGSLIIIISLHHGLSSFGVTCYTWWRYRRTFTLSLLLHGHSSVIWSPILRWDYDCFYSWII